MCPGVWEQGEVREGWWRVGERREERIGWFKVWERREDGLEGGRLIEFGGGEFWSTGGGGGGGLKAYCWELEEA